MKNTDESNIIHYTYTFSRANPRRTPPPAQASSESARPSYKARAFATFSSLLTPCVPPRYRSSAADDTRAKLCSGSVGGASSLASSGTKGVPGETWTSTEYRPSAFASNDVSSQSRKTTCDRYDS